MLNSLSHQSWVLFRTQFQLIRDNWHETRNPILVLAYVNDVTNPIKTAQENIYGRNVSRYLFYDHDHS